MLAIVLATILLSSPIPVAQGLRTTSGSPCEDKCNRFGPATNTTTSEIVCLDRQYNQTKGQDFEECISCQLTSPYVDAHSGETDVNWGLCASSIYLEEYKELTLVQTICASLSLPVSLVIHLSSQTNPHNVQWHAQEFSLQLKPISQTPVQPISATGAAAPPSPTMSSIPASSVTT